MEKTSLTNKFDKNKNKSKCKKIIMKKNNFPHPNHNHHHHHHQNENNQQNNSNNVQSTSLITIKTSQTIINDTNIENYLKHKNLEPIEIIGEGGFSTVYKVKKINDNNKLLAAKIIKLNEKNIVWIKNCLKYEMFISKLLKHPNIVKTYDYFKTNQYAVIIMEYYSFGTLRQELDRNNNKLTINEIYNIFLGLINGLQFIHNKNIAHRDLKPDNFFLNQYKQPLIGDFSFATIAIKNHQHNIIIENLLRKTRCGSDGYMAPEIESITNESTIDSILIINNDDNEQQSLINNNKYYNAKKADIYSMGICLYEMFYLKLPTKSYLLSINNNDLNSNINNYNKLITKQWQKLLNSMLKFDPNQRPTADDILNQISSPLF